MLFLILNSIFVVQNKLGFEQTMKKGIHPVYRPVVFRDPSCDFAILSRSTMKSSDKIKWEDGNEYPVINLEISSGSHPFFTGKQKLLDTAGRVEKFNKKYSKK